MKQQNLGNHARLDPAFHFTLVPLTFLILIAAIFHEVRKPSPPNLLLCFVAVALVLMVTMVRVYSLKVQDRVIRLEENVRMHWMGIDPSGLTMRQMIALRFAPDAELPALAARAAAENMTPKQIKAAIQNWRADYDRV